MVKTNIKFETGFVDIFGFLATKIKSKQSLWNKVYHITYEQEEDLEIPLEYMGYINKDSVPHGNGVLVYPCGEMLEGKFVNGKPHGLFKIFYKNDRITISDGKGGSYTGVSITFSRYNDGCLHKKTTVLLKNGMGFEIMYHYGALVKLKYIYPK